VFLDDGAEILERAHDAGGGLVMDEGDGIEAPSESFFVQGLREDGLAPLDLEGVGLQAAAAGDVEPFIGKGAVHAVEDFLATRLRREPSMTPHPEEVERKTGWLVPKRVWSLPWMEA